ncbi:class I SAM-dependent methyltransferase [Turneriella parva]|uniref:Methyltransferase type 11 n=1 Tax=Turneriella parva (strain ATCC BAA-1111 / DSM 21527 / NCTC 11395 / H) TaxID=869212 RepID=I4B0E7_TURPD|nr:class I SAM-dependent methyltransferase [Turneriella parva]AFM10754.1 Methyltransferase type 11 [Turneriella parva DSM 21527]
MINQSVWDNHYTRDRSRQQFPDENVVRVLRKNFAGKQHAVSLDLGTGSGRHLPLLVQHFEKVVACDFSRESLVIAAGSEVTAAQAALPNLPFAAESFDFVLCWGVLHYLQSADVPRAVSEILRILKPGGQVFLTLRSDSDTHLKAQLRSGDLATGHAELFTKSVAVALFQHFSKTTYGYIARQPLGEEGLVAHHMILAEK